VVLEAIERLQVNQFVQVLSMKLDASGYSLGDLDLMPKDDDFGPPIMDCLNLGSFDTGSPPPRPQNVSKAFGERISVVQQERLQIQIVTSTWLPSTARILQWSSSGTPTSSWLRISTKLPLQLNIHQICNLGCHPVHMSMIERPSLPNPRTKVGTHRP
jgi:hypothetical protein